MGKELILAGAVALSIVVLFIIMIFGLTTEYILIDGDEIKEYEIVDGNTIMIHTEDEQYLVNFFDVVIDFTVNSNITIEVSRSYFWGNPVWDGYWLNRIIKTPDLGGMNE